MAEQTAVDYLIKQISEILGPFKTEGMTDLLLVDAIQKAKQMEKEQTEISDEEIEKSMRRYNITDFGQMAAYVVGAKWMKEQILNQNK